MENGGHYVIPDVEEGEQAHDAPMLWNRINTWKYPACNHFVSSYHSLATFTMPSVHSHSAILYNASLLKARCRNAALYLQCRPFLIFLFWFSLKLFMTRVKEWISHLSDTCVLPHHFHTTQSCHFFPPQHQIQGVAIDEQCYCSISPCERNRQLLHCHPQGVPQNFSDLGQYYGDSCSKYQNSYYFLVLR